MSSLSMARTPTPGAGDVSGAIVEELLICRVCYGRFTTTDRVPKLLTCSHTFCCECIVQYLRKRGKGKGRFPCPLCRKDTILGREGVAGLGNNFTVMGLLDILDRKETASQMNTWTLPTSPGRQRPGLPGQWGPSGTSADQQQCDNCDNTQGSQVLPCGHVYCDSCRAKCDQDDCILCGEMVGVGARRKGGRSPGTPTGGERPPPYNPGFQGQQQPSSSVSSPSTITVDEHMSIYSRASTIRGIKVKPPVPQRRSPVKPIGTLPRNQNPNNQPPSLPPVNQPNLQNRQMRGSSSHGQLTLRTPSRSDSARPHTMHLSATLPRHATFASPLHQQMVLPDSDADNNGYNHSHSHLPVGMPHAKSAGNLPSYTMSPRNSSSSDTNLTSPDSMRRSETTPGGLGTSTMGRMPPRPPARRLVPEETALASPLRCLTKFGRFSTTRLQTSAFNQPTHIAASDFTQDWAVVDTGNMTLQIFDAQGGYVSLFKVLGVRCCCFLSPDKLAVGTHRGVEVCRPDGTSVRDLPVGSVVSLAPYKHGFLACLTNKIQLYSPSLALYREITRRRSGKLRRGTQYQHIVAATVNALREIVILDTGLGDISVIDEDGRVKLIIDPSKEPCGRLLSPEAIAVDKGNNILVADAGNRRLLRFSATGIFSRPLLNFSLPSGSGGVGTPPRGPAGEMTTVRGVAVGPGDRMAVVVRGHNLAQVRVYQLV